jgi:hypothetical protein
MFHTRHWLLYSIEIARSRSTVRITEVLNLSHDSNKISALRLMILNVVIKHQFAMSLTTD